MSWFCSVCEKSFSRKDSMQRHVMSKHRNVGLTPFQTVPFSQKCQQLQFEHPFTSMIAGTPCHTLNSSREFLRVRTKHGPGVHGPPLWTGSMDHFHGPGPWPPCHGPGPWTVFLIMRNEQKQK